MIRTGGGIYHGPGQIDDVNTALDNMAERYSLTSREAPGLAIPIAPFLSQARSEGITPRSLQRDRRDLYSAQWGFSIQRELPAHFTGQIGYLGSSGVKLFARQYINNIDPATGTRPLPTFGRMDEKRQDGKSSFHAMQISLHRRWASGLNWGTEYMWSHAINDGNIGGGEGAQPQIAICRACDRGNSPQDIRHTMTSNWVYELPFGPGRRYLSSGLASKVLGGWETSGIWTARTGRILTVTLARSANAVPTGIPQIRDRISFPAFRSIRPVARLLGSGSIRQRSRFRRTERGAMPAVRSPPAPAWYRWTGPCRRAHGLPKARLSSFVSRHSTCSNRTQAGNPGTTVTSPATFGLVTTGLNRTIGTGTSRQLQLAMRLNF